MTQGLAFVKKRLWAHLDDLGKVRLSSDYYLMIE